MPCLTKEITNDFKILIFFVTKIVDTFAADLQICRTWKLGKNQGYFG